MPVSPPRTARGSENGAAQNSPAGNCFALGIRSRRFPPGSPQMGSLQQNRSETAAFETRAKVAGRTRSIPDSDNGLTKPRYQTRLPNRPTRSFLAPLNEKDSLISRHGGFPRHHPDRVISVDVQEGKQQTMKREICGVQCVSEATCCVVWIKRFLDDSKTTLFQTAP